MAFGETVECLARNEVLGDLSFKLDAMGAVLGHGFHPLKARQRRSIPNLQTVYRQGRIPSAGQNCMTAVPTGYCEFPCEILRPPGSLATRIYTDIRRWTVMPRGGLLLQWSSPKH